MKKALLVATTQTHIYEFHKPLVALLKAKGIEVHVAAGNNLAGKNGISLDFVDKVFDINIARSPISLKNIKALKELKKIIKEGNYDLIQCNTPMGGILTRIASKKSRKRGAKVVYMAHGFHFCNGSPKKNWMIYYPIEKHFAKKCDTLITITEEDYKLASKKFKTNVVRMHGVGVYEERYHPMLAQEKIESRAREGISQEAYALICVGEFNQNKNQKVLISAVAKVKEKIPQIIVLLAGSGSLMQNIKDQAEELGLSDSVKFLGYRRDLETIVPACDLVISCSFREGLPLNIVEAMLSKRVVLASMNRGHNELVVDGESGYLFDPKSVDSLAEKLLKAYENRQNADIMGERGYNIALNYTVKSVEKEIKEIYDI